MEGRVFPIVIITGFVQVMILMSGERRHIVE